MTPYAIAAKSPGDASVLHEIAMSIGTPGEGEVLLRHTAIGLNYLDTYYRAGLYPWANPSDLVLGSEAAGVVEALGPGVTDLVIGQRVAYTVPNGSNRSHRIIAGKHLVPLPDGISDEVAAAVMLKGLTARYLIKDSFKVAPGQHVLFHAAAGGVGLIAGQWLNWLGVDAIGTAGGSEKCALALANGYSSVIDYRSHDFVTEVLKIVPDGVEVVYDSVGKDTVTRSLKCLKRFGTLVYFGQSSGPPLDFKLSDLAAGSFYATRPTIFHFVTRRDWLLQATSELFEGIMSGHLKISINQRFALRDAADAHRALEGRSTTGSTILIP
jgi:NADPH2:quinone reductase